MARTATHYEVEDSEFIRHVPCGSCGSSDANGIYTDGHSFCFACRAYVHGDGTTDNTPTPSRKRMEGLIQGGVKPLTKRGITEETCRKFGYRIGEHKGQIVQIAPYFDAEGNEVAQKIRYPNKDFKVLGDLKQAGLFGQHLWGPGKKIIVTEGEIDAMTVAQVQGNKWPTVSVPNGASGAKKAIAKSLEYLSQFEEVILMFDMDEPGKAAAVECAEILPPGKAKIATLSMKDPNELLKAGKGEEIVTAMWNARSYRPDGIVSVDDIIEQALAPVERGVSWFLPTLDDATYGRRLGEIYGLGAGTGVGKTDFLTQQISHDILLGIKPGVFFLEQLPTETLARVAGKMSGKAFHVPEAGWTDAERRQAFEALRGKMVLYDSWGANDWEVIAQKIRYLAQSEGITVFYLDHLTAMADTSDERASLEQIMKEMASLAVELRIMITYVSHLSTPEGKSHEEGGRVSIKHFKGSRSIGFWSHFMFALERDQQSDDPSSRGVTTFRVLKDRKTGRSTGLTFQIIYDHNTTMLSETDRMAGDRLETNDFTEEL